ncbi:MAG: acyl-protein synthetase [Eubacteriales bacterium]|nr:acyl-protein synthetase [Eubacteriales bacterium]
MRSNLIFQSLNCPEYAKILDSHGISADGIHGEEDLWRIPVLPTLYFKRNIIHSMPQNKIALTAVSSGTSGQSSRIQLDRKSLLTGIIMALRLFSYHGAISLIPSYSILLGYEPQKGNHLGAIKSAYGSTFLTPSIGRTYALKATKNGYVPNQEEVLAALLNCEKKKLPVRLVGFPMYLGKLIEELKRQGKRCQLNPHSKVLLGGGWKQAVHAAPDPGELYESVTEILGIPRENILEFFSAVEHPVAYCKCKNGNFHVPAYSRVIIRDVRSLQPTALGEAGLLSFVCPLVYSMPLLSVMTDDLATAHAPEECGCGIATPYFTLLGRAGARGVRTCASSVGQQSGGE